MSAPHADKKPEWPIAVAVQPDPKRAEWHVVRRHERLTHGEWTRKASYSEHLATFSDEYRAVSYADQVNAEAAR